MMTTLGSRSACTARKGVERSGSPAESPSVTGPVPVVLVRTGEIAHIQRWVMTREREAFPRPAPPDLGTRSGWSFIPLVVVRHLRSHSPSDGGGLSQHATSLCLYGAVM